MGAFREARAMYFKEARTRIFNVPLKGNSNHLFGIQILTGKLKFNLID